MLHTFLKYLLKNQVIFALFLIISCWFIFQIRDIIVSIFLSYIIMAAMLPMVEFLQKKKFPKIWAVVIPYVSVLIAIFLLILPLIPFLLAQIQSLIKQFPILLDSSASALGIKINPDQMQEYFTSQAGTISQNAFGVTTKVFGGFFSIITIFVVSFYLLLYNDQFKRFVARLFHHESHNRILKTLNNINEKLGAWLRGELVLMLTIGLFSWIGLTIINLPYALPLALLAGILEIVPTLGPILSAVPAVIVALTISPTMALTVVVLYILIQAIENQFLVPKVMEKAVGLNPVIVILTVVIGANLMGIGGALLAIPFVCFMTIIFKSLEKE